MATKKVGSTGRFGARYGLKLKKKVKAIEQVSKGKHKCPYCKKTGVKRVASGIWFCEKCDSKFAAKAYDPTIKGEGE